MIHKTFVEFTGKDGRRLILKLDIKGVVAIQVWGSEDSEVSCCYSNVIPPDDNYHSVKKIIREAAASLSELALDTSGLIDALSDEVNSLCQDRQFKEKSDA